MIRYATAAIFLLSVQVAQANCREDTVAIRGDFGEARFTVDVADEPDERAQGLMNVPSMPASEGMLFVYDTPQRATFWMRNTLIPLDMIFAGPDGVVKHVHENAIPLDETTIDGGSGVSFVLEINGGLSDVLGIAPGDQLQHPDIDPNIAIWPCE